MYLHLITVVLQAIKMCHKSRSSAGISHHCYTSILTAFNSRGFNYFLDLIFQETDGPTRQSDKPDLVIEPLLPELKNYTITFLRPSRNSQTIRLFLHGQLWK